MDPLIIEETENSPYIHFDPEGSKFKITGESRPEDVRKFYEPVLEWLDNYNSHLFWLTEKYSASDKKRIQFDFVFEYFNSSSAKYIMDIMSKLSAIQKNCPNADIVICWHYDEMDEDMLEAGQEFETITQIPFQFVVISE